MKNANRVVPSTTTSPAPSGSTPSRRSARGKATVVDASDDSTNLLLANLPKKVMEMAGSASGVEKTSKNKPVDPSNPFPWRHRDELAYICRNDWDRNTIVVYLRQKVFSIPARDSNSQIPLFNVTRKDGTVALPRGYRVPLMFVARFLWDSLKLVMTAADPDKEWAEYKFDIIHLARLCHHLFEQADADGKKEVLKNRKGLSKTWRCKMFDRVLTRFRHYWFVNQEWSLRAFWEEFGEEEYQEDVLAQDWVRWAYKGYKGFSLTKDDVLSGISSTQFMGGLYKARDGNWKWNTNYPNPPLETTQANTEPITHTASTPGNEVSSSLPTHSNLSITASVDNPTSAPQHSTEPVIAEPIEASLTEQIIAIKKEITTAVKDPDPPIDSSNILPEVLSETNPVDPTPPLVKEAELLPSVGEKRPREQDEDGDEDRQSKRLCPPQKPMTELSQNVLEDVTSVGEQPESPSKLPYWYNSYRKKTMESPVPSGSSLISELPDIPPRPQRTLLERIKSRPTSKVDASTLPFRYLSKPNHDSEPSANTPNDVPIQNSQFDAQAAPSAVPTSSTTPNIFDTPGVTHNIILLPEASPPAANLALTNSPKPPRTIHLLPPRAENLKSSSEKPSTASKRDWAKPGRQVLESLLSEPRLPKKLHAICLLQDMLCYIPADSPGLFERVNRNRSLRAWRLPDTVDRNLSAEDAQDVVGKVCFILQAHLMQPVFSKSEIDLRLRLELDVLRAVPSISKSDQGTQADIPPKSLVEKDVQASTSPPIMATSSAQTDVVDTDDDTAMTIDRRESSPPEVPPSISSDATVLNIDESHDSRRENSMTFVDLSSQIATKSNAQMTNNKTSSNNIMSAVMRNLTDILQHGNSRPGSEGVAYQSPIVRVLVDEVRSMKEELRGSQQRGQEAIDSLTQLYRTDIDSLSQLYRSEVDSLKNDLRVREERYRRDMETMKQRYGHELDTVRVAVQEGERQMERVQEDLPISLAEMNGRLALVEDRLRHRPFSPSLTDFDDRMDVSITRRYHPLGHLLSQEDASSTQRPSSSSIPSTPIHDSDRSQARDEDEVVPLPIKSQRKFQAIHRVTTG